MTSKAEWIALAERCEGATGPDRDLDCALYALVRRHMNPVALLESFRREISIQSMVDCFTASLDAITALIERELPGWEWQANGNRGKPKSLAWVYSGSQHDKVHKSYAATPALALCAAFCRAMAEKVAA
jgi:hypothetical protein